ncbi:MAG: hypothetical protein Q7U88_04915 [Desulfocapsaceae bacterium]|nr:hypothetical protein [Desulfocapsaceae bacterium]
MRDLPQLGIKLPPYFIGSMIPRPVHIQSQLGKGIKAFNFRGEKIVEGMADTGLICHSCLSFSCLEIEITMPPQ